MRQLMISRNQGAMRSLVGVIFLSLLLSASAQLPTHHIVAADNAGDRFTIGGITVDKPGRTVRFPAVVNMAEGTVEYLLVTSKGKTHESLFATTVEPFQLHVAMLLLSARPTQEIEELPPEQLAAGTLKAAPELEGDKVDVLVLWKSGANTRQIHAEEWINSRLTQAPMTTGPWLYTGSAIFQKRFLAQEEGSIIALVTDPVALINNPRAGRNDDTVWSVRSDKVPAVGTPVDIILHLPKSQPAPRRSIK
jgi:hypothetical protein